MARFSFRRSIAALAAAITLTTALLGNAAQATNWQGSKFLQVYSMSHVGEARSKAWHLRQKGFGDAAVFLAANGFYAVTAGKVPHGSEHVVGELKHWGKIPHDSFLTSGKAYVRQISLKQHKPVQGSVQGHLSGYGHPKAKPAHVRTYVPHGAKKIIVYGY